MKYKAVVFDLYGTLLDIHTDEESESLWQKMAYFYAAQGAVYEPSELKMTYHACVEEALQKQAQKGIQHPDCNILKVFKCLFKLKNIKASKRLLEEAAMLFRFTSLDYVLPYPGAIELLEYLKTQNLAILLLSNAQATFTIRELNSTQLTKFFDGVYLSSDYKMSKPDMGFYTAMLKREQLLASECLFIGNDHRTDIEGANAIGMDSLYVHTNCSPSEVPAELPSIWRVDSGSLYEVRAIIESLN